MSKTVAIVDLATGLVLELPGSTPTLDVPAGYDPARPAAALPLSLVRPLSGRARGEACLVEASGPGGYLHSVVEPEAGA